MDTIAPLILFFIFVWAAYFLRRELSRWSWRFRKAFRPTRRYASAPRTTYRKPVSSYVTSLPKILKGPAQVVDGDTIIIKGQSIRLAGIDAPELDHPYGRNARWAMIQLCKGHDIRAEVVAGETSYERLVATCYLPDGRDLAAELVKQGLAIDWAKFSGGKYRAHETPDARQKLWRCAAKHQGRLKSL